MMRDPDLGVAFCKVCVGVILSQIVLEESTCFVATAVYGDPWARDVVSLLLVAGSPTCATASEVNVECVCSTRFTS